MKKIILTFFVLILSITISFAEWEEAKDCAIKNDTAPVLKEYIENIGKVSKELTRLAKEEKSKDKSFDIHSIPWVWAWHSFILSTFSKIFNFDSYFSYFKYWAIFPISNEVPYEIKRDHRLLERESDNLNRYLKTIAKNWLNSVIIPDICWKTSAQNCNINKNISAWTLVSELIKNHEAITTLYRNIVIWEAYNLVETNFMLVPANFWSELKEYYSQEAYWLCSLEEWGFFDRIEESFDRITSFQNLYKDWVQKWIDAWDLLMWKDSSTKKYAEVEKRLLLNELSKNWIHWDSQKNMLEALGKFNQEWFSENSNFVYNTFNNTWNKLVEWLVRLKDDTIWDFFEKSEQQQKEYIPIAEIIKAQDNSITIVELKEKINKMYFELSRSSSESETNATNLISRIIKSHIDILDSIETLSKACRNAVKVCLKADPNKWDCWSCD